MCELWLARAFEFGNDAVGQDFTKFDAPLVERVDIPDGTLYKDLMFIERDELAERLGCQSICQDCVGWAVALEGTVWHLEGWHPICCHFFSRFAKCKRFGLGEEVCH